MYSKYKKQKKGYIIRKIYNMQLNVLIIINSYGNFEFFPYLYTAYYL